MDLDSYMKDNICPICSSTASVQHMQERFAYWIRCPKCGEFVLDNSICTDDISTQYKLRSSIYYYMTQHKDGLSSKRIVPVFSSQMYYEEELKTYRQVFLKEISTESILQVYPKDIHEKIALIMINLSKEVQYIGNSFSVLAHSGDPGKYCLFFLDENYGTDTIRKQFYGLLNLLEDEGLIADDGSTLQSLIYTITPRGWEMIDEHQKSYQSLPQGFIAMWFDTQMNSARQSIMEAVNKCGYIPMTIDMKEHNNQIVPEIFYEIQRSEFVIADLTGNRGGVYYEAGYAEGLGKQVILCCREDEFDKLHFDVKQKSTIKWGDESDLLIKLKTRIEATVGLRQKL